MKILELLKLSGESTILFFIGFTIGTILDIVFFRLYKKIDPNENNNIKLIVVLTLQIFFISMVFTITLKYNNLFVTFPLGVIISQIFLTEYVLKRILKREIINYV